MCLNPYSPRQSYSIVSPNVINLTDGLQHMKFSNPIQNFPLERRTGKENTNGSYKRPHTFQHCFQLLRASISITNPKRVLLLNVHILTDLLLDYCLFLKRYFLFTGEHSMVIMLLSLCWIFLKSFPKYILKCVDFGKIISVRNIYFPIPEKAAFLVRQPTKES